MRSCILTRLSKTGVPAGAFEGNVYVQMIGPRAYTGPLYAPGYGFNPLTSSLVTAMTGDPRYPYTCANIDSITVATGTAYEHSAGQYGLVRREICTQGCHKTPLGGVAELNYPNDYIEIRLADTYLMEAEALVQAGSNATRAKALLDAVRARVGLGSIPATLDNIYTERRLELATEGHRFFDLVRWGKAATTLAGFTANKMSCSPFR